jgi:polyferredoxin
VITVLAWAFLGLFLAGSLLGRRVWCRLCPIGACHEVFNRGGLVALRKDPGKCNRCGVCAYACPVEHHDVYEEKEMKDVSHRDCILCLRCVELCPKEDCLQLTFAGKKVVGSSFKPSAT